MKVMEMKDEFSLNLLIQMQSLSGSLGARNEIETLDIYKEVVRSYIVYHGRDIMWLKNDKQRCKTICRDEECKSMMQNVRTFYSSGYFICACDADTLCM